MLSYGSWIWRYFLRMEKMCESLRKVLVTRLAEAWSMGLSLDWPPVFALAWLLRLKTQHLYLGLPFCIYVLFLL